MYPSYQVDKEGTSCLLLVIYRGNLDMTRLLLLRGGPDLAQLAGADGFTCLHAACFHGHLAIVEVLLETCGPALLCRAAANTAAGKCMTCLHSAVTAGHLRVLERLCAVAPRGWVGLPDRDGRSALQYAQKLGRKASVQLLVAHLAAEGDHELDSSASGDGGPRFGDDR